MAASTSIAVTSSDVKVANGTAKSVVETPCAARSHRIRVFDYERDLQDLKNICANVYGGTDYMPRIIHRIAADPGILVLAAESISASQEQQPQQQQQPQQPQQPQPHHQEQCGEGPGRPAGEAAGSPPASCIDGIVCGERRGGAVWLYGLRVREGARGRGLGHVLLEAICRQAPRHLAAAPDAEPPPPSPPPPAPPPPAASRGVAPPPPAPPTSPPTPSCPPPASPAVTPRAPLTPTAAATAATVASAAAASMPVVTCTVPYNLAAQRIIGRQLAGPLYDMEIWPSRVEEYEAAVGWVRGVGVPASAPRMLDWLPGVREVLDADAAAQALLPYWRRVTSDAQLRSAVAHLLYGGSGGGGGTRASGSRGGGGGDQYAAAAAAPTRACGGLLWLPMPYDLWPLDSAFVQRELAAGNIWMLRSRGAPTGSDRAGRVAAAAANGGSGDDEGEADVAEEEEEAEDGEGGAVVGVLLLTHFDTLNRVCAGILARSNAVVHAAIAHAGRLQPHFWACTLRIPAGCRDAPPASEGTRVSERVGGDAGSERAETGMAVGKGKGEGVHEPLPEVYGVSGGHRGVLVYGSAPTP
ncbi:hypothetical protein PLESTM_001232200 [Pleodorina starrii]|nr:hypothetical protein PLESTM_001232200 [Pleodorina starrii]